MPIIGLLLLTLGLAEGQQIFYVSPGGNDANSGTAPTEAWLTLTGATVNLQRMTPNVSSLSSWSLLLARNGTWLNDPLLIDGSMLAPRVLIGAYGNESLPQPLLQHGRGLNDEGDTCLAVSGIGGDSLTVRSLQFSGCAQGITLTSSQQAPARGVIVEHNVFMDLQTPFLRYQPPNPAWAKAVTLQGTFTNFTLRNNIAARLDVFFSSGAVTTGMTVDSNTVFACQGNCVDFGQVFGLVMRNCVFLRDAGTRLFSYGVTDIIVGSVSGENSVVNNSFFHRGEYPTGPDGCAFDFEVSAAGFTVADNDFYQSWGSGLMIFGHSDTSKNITLQGNRFYKCGGTQIRDDRGGIAVMCPNHQIPTGQLIDNVFWTNPGVPAIFEAFPGCSSGLNQSGTIINGPIGMVAVPQLSGSPPDPDCTQTSGFFTYVAQTATPGATIRYTMDGSRPNEESPIFPEREGLLLPWPGPVVAINLRAFKGGMYPSTTNGAVIELNYVLCRNVPGAGDLGPNGGAVGELRGNLDSVSEGPAVNVSGWAVDKLLPRAGWGPVTVIISIDGQPVISVLAMESRPDLVTAGVAPNPEHGFGVTLGHDAAGALLGPGRHCLSVRAVGTPSATAPKLLPNTGTFWMCDGQPCT